jgi:Major Facilitator Superfamily.
VLAAQIAPSLVFALIGGVAADRFPPQRVIVAANLLMALGEGTFGLLALTGKPPLWAMIGLEAITGTGAAIFYPASQALLPRLVPRDLLQEASAISRLVMNVGQMSGAAWPACWWRPRGGLGAGALRHRHAQHHSDAAGHPGLAARDRRGTAAGRFRRRGPEHAGRTARRLV